MIVNQNSYEVRILDEGIHHRVLLMKVVGCHLKISLVQ